MMKSNLFQDENWPNHPRLRQDAADNPFRFEVAAPSSSAKRCGKAMATCGFWDGMLKSQSEWTNQNSDS
jgi:hypothetical protein